MIAQNKICRAGALLLLIALMLCLGCMAQAETDPVDFIMEISPASLTEPGEVSVSLRVANTGSSDMLDPVSLYDPDGQLVASFGDGGSCLLSAGAFRTWKGVWQVTQEQLDAGEFAYTLKYHLTDASGQLVETTRQAVARVEYAGERVKLSVSRTISPEVVRSGNKASVMYELVNSGNVDLKDIRVKENISKTAQTVSALKAGEKKTLTFTSKIGNADLTSNATITYKASGSTKTLTEKIENAPIPLARPNLKITLSSPAQGVNIGEAATLVVTFQNDGNVSYSNVSVKDEKKGEIFTNLSIPAGATVTEQKEFILMEPATFKITATLPDNTGETKTMTTDPLTIGVFDPEKTLLLTLNLSSSQESIHEVPADVRFTLVVTNNSNIQADNIAISHGTMSICSIASLAPGVSATVTRDFTLSQAGKFRFTATVKDSMQNTVSFDSNTLQITYAAPTAAPTQVPVETVAPPVLLTPAPADTVLYQTRNGLMTVAVAVGALFGAGLVLFLVSTAVRMRKKSKSNAAYDHLDLAERRDYTEPAEEDGDTDSAFDQEYRVQDADEAVPDEAALPHEKLVKPLEKAAETDAPAAENMPAADGAGGYRVSRADETAAPETNAEAPAEAAEETITLTAEEPTLEAPADEAEVPAETAQKAPRRKSRRSQRTEDGE